ncbi:MAG TPA: hypothetical protein VFG23_22780, partial [Polyangia bacterium]|nr:hypothetical protein [Polyangia bacterium]
MFLLGIAGCLPAGQSDGCATPWIAAVAAGPSGTIYLASSSLQLGAPYEVTRANDGASIWRGTEDGTTLGLLAPSTGGVVVVNGGAAARRLDASGTLMWEIGYGTTVGG